MNKVFSDDAVIITGKVIKTRPNDFGNSNTKVVYNRQTKKEYLTNLKRAFLRNKYIDVKFVLDERICDGYYYATFFKYYRRLLAHPEVLDNPPEEVNKDID